MARQPNYPTGRGPYESRPELQSSRIDTPFRGIVEYNNDPEQRGRVKVRLFQIHGPQGTDEKTRVHTKDLPWALPCFPGAGGQDFGSFMVPPVGSTVWIMFAGGDPGLPLWFGGYYGINSEGDTYLKAMGKPDHEISMDTWTGDKGPEAPLDAMEMLHASPEIYVLGKSPKGGTVAISDVDEREWTSVVDRAGQGLFLEGEVQKGPNKGNAKRRKTKSVNRGEPSIQVAGDAVASETRVSLIDAAGQSVLLNSHVGSERVRVVSRPAQGDNSGPSGSPDEMSLELDAGSGRIVIATSSGQKNKTRIVIDSKTGKISIVSPTILQLDAARVEITGELSVAGNLTVGGKVVASSDVVISGILVGGTP